MWPTLMAKAAGARHRRRRGHEADLAHALRAERTLRLGLLHQDHLGLLAVIHGLMVLAGAVVTVRHLLTLRPASVALDA